MVTRLTVRIVMSSLLILLCDARPEGTYKQEALVTNDTAIYKPWSIQKPPILWDLESIGLFNESDLAILPLPNRKYRGTINKRQPGLRNESVSEDQSKFLWKVPKKAFERRLPRLTKIMETSCSDTNMRTTSG